MTIGHCKHGEFDLEEGCAECVAERRAKGIMPENDEMEDGLNSEGLTLTPECIAERDGREGNTPATIAESIKEAKKGLKMVNLPPCIVKVQYFSETTGEISAREYTYFSEDRLAVGDLVTLPVRDAIAKAKVSAIDVPESDIAAFKDRVKTIPAGAKMEPRVELPTAAEAGEALEGAVKAVQEALPTCEEMAERFKVAAAETVDTKINLCDTCSRRNDYPICTSSDVSFGDGQGNDNIIQCGNYDKGDAKPCTIPLNVEIILEPETAVALRPGEDIEVISYHAESVKLLKYAKERVITTLDHAKVANDDLSFISKIKKAMEDRRKEYLAPPKAEIEAINNTYKDLMIPILEADRITRDQMTAYDKEQKRIRAEQEEINRKRMEAAQAEMKLKGELTESVNLVEVIEPPKRVSTELGTTGMVDHWKYEIIDITLIPREYMMLDTVLLGNTAKKYHDQKPVPGVRFYNEPIIAVRAK